MGSIKRPAEAIHEVADNVFSRNYRFLLHNYIYSQFFKNLKCNRKYYFDPVTSKASATTFHKLRTEFQRFRDQDTAVYGLSKETEQLALIGMRDESH